MCRMISDWVSENWFVAKPTQFGWGLLFASFSLLLFILTYLSATQIFKRDELICGYPGHVLTVIQYETLLSRLSEDDREIITAVKLGINNGFPFFLFLSFYFLII